MTDTPVTEAVTHMLRADDEPGRSLAIGELLDRLLRSTGLSVDKVGPVAAAMLLLWRSEHETATLERAHDLALTALRRGDFNPDELIRLTTTGRLLMGLALELQEAQLLKVLDAKEAEYEPRENDLVIWLGRHVAKVVAVSSVQIHGDDGVTPVETVTDVTILAASGQRIPVSSKGLTLYWREGAGSAPA